VNDDRGADPGSVADFRWDGAHEVVSEHLTGVLQSVSGVAQVTPGAAEDGIVQCTIHTADNADLREAISKAIVAKGWPIRRLERKRGSLDDAFFSVLRAHGPAHSHVRGKKKRRANARRKRGIPRRGLVLLRRFRVTDCRGGPAG